MKKTSSMSKDGSNLTKSHFDCYFRCSLLNLKNFKNLFWKQNSFLEHVGYLWFVKKLRKCCFWFRTYQKRFVIIIPNRWIQSLISVNFASKIEIKNYFSYQDPISDNYKNFLVYDITGTSCSISYVTKICYFNTRLRNMKKDNKSQAVQYSYSNRTCFDWDNSFSFKMIYKACSKVNLKIK